MIFVVFVSGKYIEYFSIWSDLHNVFIVPEVNLRWWSLETIKITKA